MFYRKKWVKPAAAVVISATLAITPFIVSLPAAFAAAADQSTDVQLDVRTAVLMDANSGTILYELPGSDIAYPVASMAKMMTEYIVMEQIESGKLKWEDIVTTTENAASVIGSGQMLALNEKLTVKQMFAAMSIYSANDATIALAEHVAGTEENFAKLMNQKAKELGLSDKTHFINATGLSRADMGKFAPKELEGETVSTARDMALLAYRVIKDHKQVLDFTKVPNYKLRDTDKTPMVNWNWMVEGNSTATTYLKQYAYPGLDGLKTGHTDEAGYCFTGTVERNGVRYISVIMGAPTEKKRFDETKKLLDFAFNTFEKRSLLPAKSEVAAQKTISVKKGKDTEVPVVTESGLDVMMRKDDKTEPKITVTTIDESKRVAPIKAGTVLGTATVQMNGKDVGKVNLVAAKDVDKAGWLTLLFRAIGSFFSHLFSGIKNLF